MFSGTISLSCSEFFSPFPHGTSSLSCSREYLALPDGPGRFTQNFSWSVLLRISLRVLISIRLRGYHTLWPDAPDCSALEYCLSLSRSYNPNNALTSLVWALALSLATTRTIIFIFSSCGYLDVSVPRVRLRITARALRLGCPIRTSTDQWMFAPPRRFSQLITSFFASERLGIHHTPFFTSLFLSLSRILRLFTAVYVSSTYFFPFLCFCSLLYLYHHVIYRLASSVSNFSAFRECGE